MPVNNLKILKNQKFLDLVQTILITITGTLMWAFVAIPLIILPISLPCIILRYFVILLARLLRPDLIPINNHVDNAMILKANNDDPQVMNCIQVWKIQGKLDAKKFRQHFYNEFFSTEELREKYRNLYCYYVQWMFYLFKKPVKDLDLEERIQVCRLTLVESLNLDEFIGNWMATSFHEKGKPNWKILICHKKAFLKVENKSKNDPVEDKFETILLSKIDHGLCDGYTFINLFEKITGTKSTYVVQEQKRSTVLQKLVELQTILAYPSLFALFGIDFGWTKGLKLATEKENPTPEKWRTSFTTLDVKDIKKVCKLTQSHFNTVIGTLQVGAMRRHLIECGGAIRWAEIPKHNWIMSPVPVPEHPIINGGSMTNHFSDTMWKVPTYAASGLHQTTSIDRLAESNTSYLKWQRLHLPQVINWVYKMVWPFPTKINLLLMKLFKKFELLPVSIFLSPILLSPDKPCELLGLPVDHIYVSVHLPTLLPDTQMYVCTVSNGNKLDLSVFGSSKVFSSQEEVEKFAKVLIKLELMELLASADRKMKIEGQVNAGYEV